MGHTILLADDSPTIQRLVQQTFADTGFNVVSVNNGDAAVRRFQEIRPDVVLADIYMPGKDGYEVCAYVSSHSPNARVPVVLLVGAFDAFDEGTARQAGAVAHITKPFEPQALIDLVTSVLASAGQPQTQAWSEAAPTQSRVEVPSYTAGQVVADPAGTASTGPAQAGSSPDTGDLLGLNQLFPPPVPAAQANVSSALSAEQIDIIADRVLQKLSARVVESVAWDVVPDIAVKILRDELKRTTHEG
jgi:CheY-like chemotaxis protein